MLHATIIPGHELSSGGQIAELQTALAALAQSTGNPLINPGKSGVVDNATIRAVGQAASLVKKYAPDKVPGWVWTGLGNMSLMLTVIEWGASAVGLSEEDIAPIREAIVTVISSGAPYLTVGAKAATLAMGKGAGPTAPSTAPSAADRLRLRARPMATGPMKLAPPPRSKYRAGSVTAQDPKSSMWIVAAPKNSTLGGGLGANPEGVQYEIIDKTTGQPAMVVVIKYNDLKKWLKPPWYKSPWFWGGAAVLSVGGFVGYRVIRRRA